MINLRRLLDLPILVILMGAGCAVMVLPAAYAVALGQFDVARAFFYSGCVLLVLTAMIALATASHRAGDREQGLLLTVVCSYILVPVILAVPLHQSVPELSFHAAWFEMISCFTATGATVFAVPETLADPIHFWRALIGWLGGFYTLLVVTSVLAPVGLGGVELLVGRSQVRAGPAHQRGRTAGLSQRMFHFAALLFPIYAGLTLALWVALLVAGDTALIALCHAMGTLSTSGISSASGLVDAQSGFVGEALIVLCLGFALSRRLWPVAGMTDKTIPPLRDPELGLAFCIVGAVTAVLILRLFALGYGDKALLAVYPTLGAVWTMAFTSLSFLTTTGFQSAAWPDLGMPGLLLMGLAMIGGGVATTAGGIKLMRVYALLRHGERELERIVHPHSIGGHGPVARRLRREGAYLAWIYFMVFGLSIAAVTVALTLFGLGFENAFILGIACLSTTGQLATVVGNTPILYGDLGAGPMGILGIAMILGRLEILAVVGLLVPKGWSGQT